MLFKVTNIYWDLATDDNAPEPTNLPDTMMIKITEEYNSIPPVNVFISNESEYEDIVEDIINQLSDTQGWCVHHCTMMRVE